jgi:hypothetical protein
MMTQTIPELRAGPFHKESSGAALPQPTPEPDAPPRLIFVAGIMRRAGTNYIGHLLLSHPDVCRPAGHWELPLCQAADQFAAFHRAFLGGRDSGRLDYSFEQFAHCFGDGLIRLLAGRAEPRGAKYMLNKHPGTRGIEHFQKFFPEAKLIFLVRDGRDNVNSLLTAAGFRAGGRRLLRPFYVYKFARDWAASARRILACVATSGCPVVKYEDLHLNARETARAIAEYVGLPPSDEWLEGAKRVPVAGSGFYRGDEDSAAESPGEAQWRHLPKTSKFQPVGRWRNSWSSLDRLVFRLVAGRELHALGYA